MSNSQKQITDSLRACWTADLMAHIVNNHDTDVCQIAAGTFMFPVVDASGEDRWVKVNIVIPKDAAEENGNDGYALAEEYRLKQQAAEERRIAAAEKAAEKKVRAEERAARAAEKKAKAEAKKAKISE